MSGRSVTVITSNKEFFTLFPTLDHTCIVNSRLRLSPGEEHLLLDLLERGVHLIPSATSQLTSRSKVHQARIFSEFMLPHTCALYNANDLLATISLYNQAEIREVVVKRDRKNGGIGIHRFRSIEDLHNQAAFGHLEFPVVIQPFIDDFRDLRIIILGDYSEAYERFNPSNFRHNLHCGGRAVPCEMSATLQRFCTQVMARGRYPYAHIDLMILPSGDIFLTEINLRGGLRGAKINGRNYLTLVDKVNSQLLTAALSALATAS